MGYAYEEEQESDFSNYFNENSIEEQNAEMEPAVFWTMNIFAIFSGVVLCFFMFCYFLRKKRGKYEFVKETDFEESASECSQYGFHPINVAMQQRMSDEEDDNDDIGAGNQEEQEPLQNQNKNVDEYASEISAIDQNI